MAEAVALGVPEVDEVAVPVTVDVVVPVTVDVAVLVWLEDPVKDGEAVTEGVRDVVLLAVLLADLVGVGYCGSQTNDKSDEQRLSATIKVLISTAPTTVP